MTPRGPRWGLPLLVAVRAQVRIGHCVGRGHPSLRWWAALAPIACSCSSLRASPPLLSNAFDNKTPVCSSGANAGWPAPEAVDSAVRDAPSGDWAVLRGAATNRSAAIDLRCPGAGRRHVGELVGELPVPDVVVLGEAHPFGRHDRLGLIEQDRIIVFCVGGHSAHPLSPRIWRPSRCRRSGVDRRLLTAGDLDAARLGLLGDRDRQP